MVFGSASSIIIPLAPVFRGQWWERGTAGRPIMWPFFWLGGRRAETPSIVDFGPAVAFEAALNGGQGVGIDFRPTAFCSFQSKEMACLLESAGSTYCAFGRLTFPACSCRKRRMTNQSEFPNAMSADRFEQVFPDDEACAEDLSDAAGRTASFARTAGAGTRSGSSGRAASASAATAGSRPRRRPGRSCIARTCR